MDEIKSNKVNKEREMSSLHHKRRSNCVEQLDSN